MSERFAEEIEPFRGELLAHCYRMTGALSDAEDALQNAFVRAWRSLDSFEGRASLRTWLYKIATNACLDLLASRKVRTMPEVASDEQSKNDPAWVEPFPGPDTAYASREAVRLAFVVALQVLPPRQRAALILRDVVGFSAEETAAALDTSVAAINSALQRARAVLDEQPRATRPPVSGKLGELLGNYLRLWEAGDARGLVALLREDAIMSMPPVPLWGRGPEAIGHLLETVVFPNGATRAVPCSANGAPAFALYKEGQLAAITVLDIEGDKIVAIQSFLGVDGRAYGLPSTLPLDARIELVPGAVLGRYTLDYVLGSGGMGHVWRAFDRDLERDVALKVLHQELADDENARARLLREARAMAKVRHTNVLAIYDVTNLAGHDVLVMELVEGEDMAKWARRGRSYAEVLATLAAAGRGLAAVHAAGLVHRDFKPANVLVGSDGRVLVGDFGLSRALNAPRGSIPRIASPDERATAVAGPSARLGRRGGDTTLEPPATGDPMLTGEGTVLGTPAYMAPEQLRAEDADARSDQFAFAMTAWELLAGGQAYSSKELETIAGGDYIEPHHRSHLPDGVRAVLTRALSTDRGDRWPSLDELLDAL